MLWVDERVSVVPRKGNDEREMEGNVLVLARDTPLHPQHLLEGVFITVPHLELLPMVPEVLLRPRIGKLARVSVDGSCAVDLAEAALHLRKLQTHVFGLFVGEGGDRSLVDGARGREAEVRR